MQILANSAYAAIAAITGGQKTVKPVDASAASAASSPLSSTQVTLSAAARALSAATQPSAATTTQQSAVVTLQTDQGLKNIDLDHYFTHWDNSQPPPLLLPNAETVNALKQHASGRMTQFLQAHQIPSAPASLRFTPDGDVALPNDYPYSDQFKQALKQDQNMGLELEAISSLSSMMVEAQKMSPYYEAMEQAQTEADAQAVYQRFKYLFNTTTNPPTEIELHFSSSNQISVSANGQTQA